MSSAQHRMTRRPFPVTKITCHAKMAVANIVGRQWHVILIVFAFSAIATPTGDPVNMTLLAVPVLLLISIATGIAWVNDRRRARKRQEDPVLGLSDDEASPEPKPSTDI